MDLITTIQEKIDQKTKPLGSLGILEKIALQIATIQQTLTPQLINPHLVIFAADHGIANNGVSAYPKEVTAQMVKNFLNNGAAINVFCDHNKIKLKIVDAGVNYTFNDYSVLINAKVDYGTANMLHSEAMRLDQFEQACLAGSKIVQEINENGCNIIGFGEMGIGNTSSSALILAQLFNLPLEETIGKGTGLNIDQLEHKRNILLQVLQFHGSINRTPQEILRIFGGYEIVQMYAAMKTAKSKNMILLIDGFIATAAFSAAYFEDQSIMNNAIFCHQSDEQAHQKILNLLKVTPLLHLNLRVGEGTGCALAYPIIENAVNFFNNMASFESAKISNK